MMDKQKFLHLLYMALFDSIHQKFPVATFAHFVLQSLNNLNDENWRGNISYFDIKMIFIID